MEEMEEMTGMEVLQAPTVTEARAIFWSAATDPTDDDGDSDDGDDVDDNTVLGRLTASAIGPEIELEDVLASGRRFIELHIVHCSASTTRPTLVLSRT